MRRRLVVAPFLRSASVAVALTACSVAAQAASVQTVFSAENALYGAGYNVGQADGWIDDSLRAAVRQYQSDRPDLSATGELDAPTLDALGISGGRAELMGGNVVANTEAARKELGLAVASAPKPAPTPAPAPAPKAKPKPEPKPAPPQPVATPKPVVKPEPVVAKVPKVSEPVPQPEPQKAPAPEPKQVAKTAAESAPTQSEPEPTSDPIVIASNVGSSSRDKSAPAPEQTVAVATAETAEQVEAAAPQEVTAAENDRQSASAETGSNSEPKDRQGNVITRVFDFLFGWMV